MLGEYMMLTAQAYSSVLLHYSNADSTGLLFSPEEYMMLTAQAYSSVLLHYSNAGGIHDADSTGLLFSPVTLQ